MRIDLGLGPASPAVSRRLPGTGAPGGFEQLVLRSEAIVHRGEPVILRTEG